VNPAIRRWRHRTKAASATIVITTVTAQPTRIHRMGLRQRPGRVIEGGDDVAAQLAQLLTDRRSKFDGDGRIFVESKRACRVCAAMGSLSPETCLRKGRTRTTKPGNRRLTPDSRGTGAKRQRHDLAIDTVHDCLQLQCRGELGSATDDMESAVVADASRRFGRVGAASLARTGRLRLVRNERRAVCRAL
jgi:hypothetical protein